MCVCLLDVCIPSMKEHKNVTLVQKDHALGVNIFILIVLLVTVKVAPQLVQLHVLVDHLDFQLAELWWEQIVMD